ncbi:MAG TPA: NADH-quinone oxidoreductase subunit NuoE [Usitatibacter sp.]|nr:NADH-quinone oxidoreductase subunit NuoE [Usitatibacter sp.]
MSAQASTATGKLLSGAALARIEREAAKYPPDQRHSAVISALGIAQDEHGWLSNELMEEVAQVLGMPPVWVYEVATFYNMYNLKPPGRHKLVMCTNLPCALSGAVEAAEHLKRRCGVEDFNQTSADGRFTVKEGECFGACGDAPVMIVDNKRVCARMTPEKLDALLKELD